MSSSKEILISLHSKYVKKILNGTKTVELRRRQLKVEPGTLVWIYSKVPQAAVAARAEVVAIVTGNPARLWKRFGPKVGITQREFRSYFGTRSRGCAILLKDVIGLQNQITLRELRERVASFHPPQFYSKLERQQSTLRALRSRLRHSGTE